VVKSKLYYRSGAVGGEIKQRPAKAKLPLVCRRTGMRCSFHSTHEKNFKVLAAGQVDLVKVKRKDHH
jgi:hypothetical protein